MTPLYKVFRATNDHYGLCWNNPVLQSKNPLQINSLPLVLMSMFLPSSRRRQAWLRGIKKRIIVYHRGGYQLPAWCQCVEMQV